MHYNALEHRGEASHGALCRLQRAYIAIKCGADDERRRRIALADWRECKTSEFTVFVAQTEAVILMI